MSILNETLMQQINVENIHVGIFAIFWSRYFPKSPAAYLVYMERGKVDYTHVIYCEWL